MKQSWEASARRVSLGLFGWLLATDLLVWVVHLTDWWICKAVLFLCISFLPGIALLRAIRMVLKTPTVYVLYSFGLSILTLIVSGLATNQFLHVFMARPLGLFGIVGTWSIVTATIITLGIFTNTQSIRFKKWPYKKLSNPALALLFLSLLLPCGAVFGAFRLNNGGDALFAELTLCSAAALIIYTFLLRRHLPDGLLAWFIFILGLTLLLMTSLRGWDIVGHDIEREFRVYTLTHLHGYWDIGLDRQPYNSCLSITILPEMFAKILSTSGLFVFKVVLQIIFAACPVVLYVLLRRYASKLGALVGSLLFLCYPTFVNDSAMLTRQDIAYLFFALALLILSNEVQKKRDKLLFLCCVAGAILSHYSTAYMFVALFVMAVICKHSMTWWWQRKKKSPHLTTQKRTILSPLFALLLFLMTFMWYTQITATSQGLATTLRASVANIPKLFSGDNNNKSSDTSTALFFAGGKNQIDLYQSYLSGSSHSADALVSTAQYIPGLTSDDLPITNLGKKAASLGVSPSFIITLRQNFARVLQLLALAGVIYATHRLLRRKAEALSLDFICLNIAGLVLLGLMVLLPVLSINYGVLRAFQQALIFLTLPIVLLLVQIKHRIWNRLGTPLAATGIVLLFLLFTGMFAQILGGVSPSLSMNNSGLYFGLYYSPSADSQSFAWIKTHIPKGNDVRAANFNRAAMHDPDYPFSRAGILPSQVSSKSYVYTDSAQIQKQKLYTYYQSSPLIMTFPLDYYDRAKNQIYSTVSTRVYK